MDAMEGKKFMWTWVKGHADNQWNEYVDSLCTAASAKI